MSNLPDGVTENMIPGCNVYTEAMRAEEERLYSTPTSFCQFLDDTSNPLFALTLARAFTPTREWVMAVLRHEDNSSLAEGYNFWLSEYVESYMG